MNFFSALLLTTGMLTFGSAPLLAGEISNLEIKNCDRSGKNCLQIVALQGDVSQFDSLMVIKHPRLLEFKDGKIQNSQTGESATIDLRNGQIVLNQQVADTLIETEYKLVDMSKRIYRTKL